MLLDLYMAMGSFEAGIMLFNELDVKQIQCDSLSWLLMPGCASCGFFNEVGPLDLRLIFRWTSSVQITR